MINSNESLQFGEDLSARRIRPDFFKDSFSPFPLIQAKTWGEYGKSPKKCRKPLILMNKNGLKPIIKPCGLWNCEYCGSRKQKDLRQKVKIAFQGKKVRMITLTILDDEDIDEQFNTFNTAMHNRGYLIRYFKRKEFQRRGVRHLHILTDDFIPKSIIKSLWPGRAHIEYMRDGSALYVTKYLTCNEDYELYDKGERRYTHSKGLFQQNFCKLHFPGYEYVHLNDEERAFFVEEYEEKFKERVRIYLDKIKHVSFKAPNGIQIFNSFI